MTRHAVLSCCHNHHATPAWSLFAGLDASERAIHLARINAAIAYTSTQRHRPNIARADDKLRNAATVLAIELALPDA